MSYMPKTKSEDYGTPDWLYDQLDDEFHFTVDAAASRKNAKCKRYFTKKEDGLKQLYGGEVVFINPPFDHKSLKAWTAKMWEESRSPGTIAVMLVPAKTDQSWWHQYGLKVERRFIPGRVKFKGAKDGNTQPIIILVFEKGRRSKARTFDRNDRRGKNGSHNRNTSKRSQKRSTRGTPENGKNRKRHLRRRKTRRRA